MRKQIKLLTKADFLVKDINNCISCKGRFKYYVLLLGGRGRGGGCLTKLLQKITEGVRGGHQMITRLHIKKNSVQQIPRVNYHDIGVDVDHT